MVEATAIPQMSDEDRAALAEQLGYTKIGKELPDDVTLQGIIKSLPDEASRPWARCAACSLHPAPAVANKPCLMTFVQVFELNPVKAWSAVFITLASVAASLYLISVSPWYLLPFAWALAGTAFTGVSLINTFRHGTRRSALQRCRPAPQSCPHNALYPVACCSSSWSGTTAATALLARTSWWRTWSAR